MTEREQIEQEVHMKYRASVTQMLADEKKKKLENYRQMNVYIHRGKTLFTGSSLMENFPIMEFCMNEGFPVVYNRGIGGYTSDEFLAAIDTVLLDLQPAKLFINIGTNDISLRNDGESWFEHWLRNERRICEIIKEKLPQTLVYLMAYYPVNANAPLADRNPGMKVRTNENIAIANRRLAELAAEFGFLYIDVNDGLKDAKGNLQIEHTQDGIHFDVAAYRTVFERLKPYLEQRD